MVKASTSKRKWGGKSKGAKPKKKTKGNCYVCDKPGHHAKDCYKQKDKEQKPGKGKKKVTQANVAETDNRMHLMAMVSEVNLVGSNPKEWWVDTGATSHICSNRWMFKTYTKVSSESYYMGNSAISKVEGKGTVVLKMTSVESSEF